MSTDTPQLPENLSVKLTGVQRLLEAGLLVSFLFSMFTMLALFSFDAADPGWAQTGYLTPIRNMGGSVGAYLADLLLNMFGLIAYTLPFVIALVGWLLFQKYHRLLQLDFLTLGLKLIGFIMFYIGVTSLASMNFDDIFYFSAGGILGDALSNTLLPYFSFVGCTLLFLWFFTAGFVLLTGFSWLKFIDQVGEYTIQSIQYLITLPKTIKQKFGPNSDNQTEMKSDNSVHDIVNAEEEKRAADEQLSEEKEQKLLQKALSSIGFKKAKDNDSENNLISPENFITSPVENAALDRQMSPMYANEDLDGTNQAEPIANSKPVIESDHFKVQEDLNTKEPDEFSEKVSTSVETKIEPTFTMPPIDIKIEPNFGSVSEERAIEQDPTFDPIAEPFVDIDDLIDGPQESIQEHVNEKEVTAAFADVEKFDVSTPIVTPNPASTEVFDKYKGMPSIALLDRPDKNENPISQEELDYVSRLVEAKLLDFGVHAQVVSVYPGPVITRFELDLAPGVKVSKISGLSKDLARALSAISVRVVEVIPGKSVIGLELPNKHREIVYLSEVIASPAFEESSSPLAMVLGKDIAGAPVVVDLGKMPHLLVAGTTGSGKSVGVNTMIISLLYKSTPEDVRMIMIDPKMLELSVYEGIPHLLSEVVTDMKDAANALRWCVGEMERRYKVMSAIGVRNLKGYNKKVLDAIAAGEPLIDPTWQPSDSLDQTPPLLEKLPSIVVIVDEFADMMMIVGKKVEELIARIAQKARAAGIHLVLATQRPSVDVITGLIKANIPTRMAFQVSSGLNSRTILDQQGAEQLLGMGDMLYLPPGTGVPTRVHGAFVDDHEVHAVVDDWKSRGEPNYVEEILSGDPDQEVLLPGEVTEGEESTLDALYDEAVGFVTLTRRVSISSVQRKFRIGYNRAARIVEDMEAQGVVSGPGHNGAREVLAPPPVKD